MGRRLVRQVAAATPENGFVNPSVLCDTVAAPSSRALAGGDHAVQFQAVLDNMAQRLCLFDEKQQLIVCNHRYAEIYGLSAEHVRPGATLREIVEQRYLKKTTPAMSPAEYLLWRDQVEQANEPHDSTVELLDGRMIAIRHQPMPDGGWLATHEDITARLQTARDLAHLSRNFAVTGLPNRATIADLLQEVLNRPTRPASCAVLLLRLNGMNDVNDTMGRRAGDAMLRILSERVRNTLRPADLLGHVSVSEFIVVQCEAPQPAAGFELMRRLINVVGQPVELEGQQMAVGVNGGIAVGIGSGLQAETLLQNSSIALNRARAEGRDQFRLFEPQMDDWMQARRSLESDLREAVVSMAFDMRYQPQFDTKTKRVVGFEALLRWEHPVRGPVDPGVFIPLAEEIGLIGRIGEWTLQQACVEASRWPDQIEIAVNLSPLQLKADLPEMVSTALGQSNLLASRLEIEITETSMMADRPTAALILGKIRDTGVRIAIDDFGKGYASLSHLSDLPFDTIKIDRSFVAKLGEGKAHDAIVRAIIGLSATVGASCTAEGVETEAQLTFLARENCTKVQGYLLGHPLAAPEIPAILPLADADDHQKVAQMQEARPTRSGAVISGIFFRQIVDFANDVIIVTDAALTPPGPRILYVNPAFTKLTGYSAGEAVGRSPRMLQGEGTSRTTLNAIRAELEAGRETHRKVLNYAKHGAPYWLDLRIVPLRDVKGQITRFVAVERDVTLDKRRLDELEYVADRDTLTGIPNRRAFFRTMTAELWTAQSRSFSGLCLAFIDVDNFKQVNDRYGHATGDAVLFSIADRLAGNVRRVDTLGRIGGEEFAVCMPSIVLREAFAIGERMRRAVEAEPFDTPNGPLRVTVSVGVSEARQGEGGVTELLERADRAMYSAKKAGRDRVASDPILATLNGSDT